MRLTTHRRHVLVVLTAFGITIGRSAGVHAQNRYFPPNTPFVLPNQVTVQSYGTAFTQFDRDVVDTVKEIDAGRIQFDYNTWNAGGNPSTGGGGALTGGFFMNQNVTVKTGFTLHWIQIVGRDTTTNGENDWGWGDQAQNTPFPDSLTNSPIYTYEALLPGVNPNPAPTLGFTDFPARPYSWGNQEWLAELALTCVANNAGPNGSTEVRVVGSFFWGFGISTLPNNAILRREPGLWGLATNDYLNTMNDYFDGTAPGGTATPRFSFANNTNCFQIVPEPASPVLMLAGAMALLRRRHCRGYFFAA